MMMAVVSVAMMVEMMMDVCNAAVVVVYVVVDYTDHSINVGDSDGVGRWRW